VWDHRQAISAHLPVAPPRYRNPFPEAVARLQPKALLKLTSLAPAAALASALVVAQATGCDAPARPAPERAVAPKAERPHVLVAVVDACRADKFGAYGFERPTTPEFDALAAEPDSVLFSKQFSQAPHTRASTASLFTGVYPFQHGVFNEDDLTPQLRDGGRYRGRLVAEAYDTLAERFSAGGYRTLATTSNPVIAGRFGYDQGFDEYHDPGKSVPTDEALVDEAVAFLARSPAPGFVYVHATGCHNPIEPERRDADYLARFGGGYDQAAMAERGLDPASPKLKFVLRKRRQQLDTETVGYLNTTYESLVRHIDRTVVARLVAGLRQGNLYDRTLLVITSDHGEELLEHGEYTHGRSVWNEVLHVPLVVKFPRDRKPARLPAKVERVTQTVDLYPGLLRAAGLEVGAGISGHDLFDPDAKRELAYAQAPGVWALIDYPNKVVVSERARRARLFDLAADPRERADQAQSRPDELRRLVRVGEGLRELLPKIGAAQAESELTLDPATIEQLRSLGYIQ
jgi:arylsulfatase A-like enzyme